MQIVKPVLGLTLGFFLLSIFLCMDSFFPDSFLGVEVLGAQFHGSNIAVVGNDVLVLEGEHLVNGSIYVEENGTLVLRNAVINFTQTGDYQFQIRLVNPRGGNPRLVVENSDILSGGYQLGINLYYNSTATIRGLETSDGVRLNGYGDSVIDVSDSIIRGQTLYGHGDCRLNVTNTSMVGLYAEGDTRIHARGCEIDIVHAVVRSADVSIQGLVPGYVGYWDLEGNHSILFDPLDWRPEITLEDCYVEGFGFHFSKAVNGTIKDSHLRSVTTTSQTRLFIQNSFTDFGLSTRHDSEVYAKDCRFGSSTAKENSTLELTNTTFFNHWMYHQSHRDDYWYLDLAVTDPENQTIPGATITVTHPNQTIVATGNTGQGGLAGFTLLGGTKNASGTFPVGPYTVMASHDGYMVTVDVEMVGNRKIGLTIPYPVPELPEPIWVAFLLGALLPMSGRRILRKTAGS
jgi:hypothetical protein